MKMTFASLLSNEQAVIIVRKSRQYVLRSSLKTFMWQVVQYCKIVFSPRISTLVCLLMEFFEQLLRNFVSFSCRQESKQQSADAFGWTEESYRKHVLRLMGTPNTVVTVLSQTAAMSRNVPL